MQVVGPWRLGITVQWGLLLTQSGGSLFWENSQERHCREPGTNPHGCCLHEEVAPSRAGRSQLRGAREHWRSVAATLQLGQACPQPPRGLQGVCCHRHWGHCHHTQLLFEVPPFSGM